MENLLECLVYIKKKTVNTARNCIENVVYTVANHAPIEIDQNILRRSQRICERLRMNTTRPPKQ